MVSFSVKWGWRSLPGVFRRIAVQVLGLILIKSLKDCFKLTYSLVPPWIPGNPADPPSAPYLSGVTRGALWPLSFGGHWGIDTVWALKSYRPGLESSWPLINCSRIRPGTSLSLIFLYFVFEPHFSQEHIVRISSQHIESAQYTAVATAASVMLSLTEL